MEDRDECETAFFKFHERKYALKYVSRAIRFLQLDIKFLMYFTFPIRISFTIDSNIFERYVKYII